jgi:hypothetical protein
LFPYRVAYDETYDTPRASLMAARPISVRLSEDMLSAMDRYLASPDAAATIRTRTQLIQAALDMWLQADEAARIDAAIVAGYTRFPVGPEEQEFGRISDLAQKDLDEW